MHDDLKTNLWCPYSSNKKNKSKNRTTTKYETNAIIIIQKDDSRGIEKMLLEEFHTDFKTKVRRRRCGSVVVLVRMEVIK